MAELSDLFTWSSKGLKDVSIEMLDYGFLDKCNDTDLIRSILWKLRSGEEGHYPDLTQHAENRLLEVLPKVERSKILRMKMEPKAEEINQASLDLHDWVDGISEATSKFELGGRQQRHDPIWPSYAEMASEGRSSKLVEFENTGTSYIDDRGGTMLRARNDGVEQKKRGVCNFRAWQKYDVDQAIKEIEEDENEEQALKNKEITSVKARVQHDTLRRAKKREHQLQELGRGRFKEPLSLFEKKHVAERERIKGNESFKACEYEEAFRCYTFSLELDATSAMVYSNRAAAALKMGRFAQAEDDCTRAISFDPDFKRAWVRRGTASHRRGKYASAVADFRKALALDLHDKNVQSLLKLSAAKEYEVEGKATESNQGVPEKNPGRVLIEEVDTLQEDHGENTKQSVLNTRIIPPPVVMEGSKRTPQVAEGRINIVDELESKLRPRETNGLHVTEVTYRSLQQPRRVMVTYDSSEEEGFTAATRHSGIIPENLNIGALMECGRNLYEVGDFNAAAGKFVEAIQSHHSAIQAVNNLCACKLKQGFYNEALRCAEQVLEVDPDNLKALFRKWRACIHMNETRKAAEALSALDNLSSRSLMKEMRGRQADGREPGITLFSKQPALDESDKLRKEGKELMEAGHPEFAIEKYTSVLERHPSDLRARNNRAQIYLKLQRFEEAEADAGWALQLDPGNIKAIYRRGRARLGQPHRDKDGACADFARVLSNSPGNTEAVDLLMRAVDGLGLDGHSATLDKDDSGLSTPSQVNTRQAPKPLTIVEDGNEERSWCPLATTKCHDDEQVSEDFWHEGERLLRVKNWARAREMFAQGVVANPSNVECWNGLSRVHREQGNYRESEEAASRARKAVLASSEAPVCSAVACSMTDKLVEDGNSELGQNAVK